jgi:aminoglycoside phosphotransferase (APT) family kinase protein
VGTLRGMELLAEGRTAEVFAYGEGRVLKLDRPDWNGLSAFEGTVLAKLADAGLPVARPHGTVTVEGRPGLVLDRIEGPSLLEVVAASNPAEVDRLAARFAALQLRCNRTTLDGLPDLVARLHGEIEASVPDRALRAELLTLLHELDDGGHGVCHFDFHPLNVLVGSDGWVVIDWLTVASGPPAADLARTLVLWGQRSSGTLGRFLRVVRRDGRDARGLGDETLDAWVRVVAAARVAEGFDGEEREWLLRVAGGSGRLFA